MRWSTILLIVIATLLSGCARYQDQSSAPPHDSSGSSTQASSAPPSSAPPAPPQPTSAQPSGAASAPSTIPKATPLPKAAPPRPAGTGEGLGHGAANGGGTSGSGSIAGPTGDGSQSSAVTGQGAAGSQTPDRSPASVGAAGPAGDSGSSLDNLPSAKAVVSHPDPMQVDREETVTVAVSLNMSANLDMPSTQDMAKTKQHMENTPLAVKASPFMRVDIQESPHFKVRYLGPDRQRMQSVGKDPAYWPFSVTPIDAGKWKLHVTVTNYASENDHAGRILLRQDETINVKVLPPMQMAKRYVMDHWNWNWLWTTIIVPLWAYLRRYFKKKKGGVEAKSKGSKKKKKAGAA